MKIAIMGSGGVGGYFGARLAQAGEEVCFIARGAHLAAMKERGLAVRSVNGDLTIRPVNATSDPAGIGPWVCWSGSSSRDAHTMPGSRSRPAAGRHA